MSTINPLITSALSSFTSTLRPLKISSVRTLWFILIISDVGDWAARLALSLLVYQQTQSPLAATLVTTIGLLPWFGIGQYLSTFADKYPHKTIMVIASLVSALVFLALALFTLPLWFIFILSFVAGCANPPFDAARSSMLPQVSKDAYLPSLTLMGVTGQLSTLIGFAAGGLAIAVSSVSLALAVNAFSFVLAGLLVLTLPRTSANTAQQDGESTSVEEQSPSLVLPEQSESQSSLALMKKGALALVQDRFILIGALVVTIAALGGISAESLLVPYADALKLSESGTGLLAAVMPAAALLIALFLPSEGNPRHLLLWVCWSTIVASVISGVLFAISGSVLVAVIALIFAGTLNLTTIPAGAVIGTRLPAKYRASAFSVLQGSLQTVQSLGALLAGAIATLISVPASLAILSIPGVIAAIVGIIMLREKPKNP